MGLWNEIDLCDILLSGVTDDCQKPVGAKNRCGPCHERICHPDFSPDRREIRCLLDDI